MGISEVTARKMLEMVARSGDDQLMSVRAMLEGGRGLETGGGSKVSIGHLGPQPRLVAKYLRQPA